MLEGTGFIEELCGWVVEPGWVDEPWGLVEVTFFDVVWLLVLVGVGMACVEDMVGDTE